MIVSGIEQDFHLHITKWGSLVSAQQLPFQLFAAMPQ
jgi:hypothetical protein